MRGLCFLLLSLATLSASAFEFVRDGTLVAKPVGGESAAEKLATDEYLRIMKAVTGCATDAAALEAAKGTIVLKIDPSLGGSDTYEIREEGGPRSVAADTEVGPPVKGLVLAGNNERSVWFAMCALLEQLGCRWYWVGADGEYLPAATKTLAAEVKREKSTAAFAWRGFGMHPHKEKWMFVAHNKMNPLNGGKWTAWEARFRVDWGQVRSTGGHYFSQVCPPDCKNANEYFKKHPEQWALIGGKRSREQHCYTNPDTIATFVGFIDRFWDEHPECEILGLSPLDAPKYCRCETCSKFKTGSDLYFNFLKTIVEGAERKHPGKRYKSFAYAFYWLPPENVKLPSNILIDYCMYNRCYTHPFADKTCAKNEKPQLRMQQWRDLMGGAAPSIYGYHFDCWGQRELTPVERVIQDELKWARDFGVTYWHTELFQNRLEAKKGQPAPDPLDDQILTLRFPVYCATRLAWNPDLDLDDVKRDWCARVYGAAKDEMVAYFTALEDLWSAATTHPSWYFVGPSEHVDGILNAANIAKVDALFAAGEKKLAGSMDTRAKDNFTLDRRQWEHWRDLKLERDRRQRRALGEDPVMESFVLRRKAGEIVYPRPGKNDPTSIEYRKTKVKGPNGKLVTKDEGRIWGNKPAGWSGEKWLNYEVTFRLRFPGAADSQPLNLTLRKDGHRYGQEFYSICLHLSQTGYSADVWVNSKKESLKPINAKPVKPTKFAKPLGDSWHDVKIRLADTHTILTLDGNKVFDAGVPFGTGGFMLQTPRDALDIADFTIREIPDPAPEQYRAYEQTIGGPSRGCSSANCTGVNGWKNRTLAHFAEMRPPLFCAFRGNASTFNGARARGQCNT